MCYTRLIADVLPLDSQDLASPRHGRTTTTTRVRDIFFVRKLHIYTFIDVRRYIFVDLAFSYFASCVHVAGCYRALSRVLALSTNVIYAKANEALLAYARTPPRLQTRL